MAGLEIYRASVNDSVSLLRGRIISNRQRWGNAAVKVLLKDRQLGLIPEDAHEADDLAAWKLLHLGHVLLIEHHEGTGAPLVDLGPRETACREPINVTSAHPDPAVRLIGTFAETPFVLDDERYQ